MAAPLRGLLGRNEHFVGDANQRIGTQLDGNVIDTRERAIGEWAKGLHGFAVLHPDHVYALGGIYTVTVALVDNAAATDTETTQAIISGAGVVDGVLYVIGTPNDKKP
jgi:hypothetical protein